MSFREPNRPESEPAPTPEARLLSAFAEAFVATRPKDEALRWLRVVARILHDREAQSAIVVRLRRSERERQRAEAEADRQAVALYRRMLEGCVARLLPEAEDLDDEE